LIYLANIIKFVKLSSNKNFRDGEEKIIFWEIYMPLGQFTEHLLSDLLNVYMNYDEP